MADDRRREERYLSCVPVGVRVDSKERVALIQDASATGARLLSQRALPIGSKVTLGVLFETDKPTVDIEAKVVRVETLTDSIWSCRMAVAFEPPRPDLVKQFAQHPPP